MVRTLAFGPGRGHGMEFVAAASQCAAAGTFQFARSVVQAVGITFQPNGKMLRPSRGIFQDEWNMLRLTWSALRTSWRAFQTSRNKAAALRAEAAMLPGQAERGSGGPSGEAAIETVAA